MRKRPTVRRGVVVRSKRCIMLLPLYFVLRSLCFPAETWTGGSSKIDVPRPDLLLNHMADRYTSTPRILMEFVDNSFDDAETFFDNSTNSYTRKVMIRVEVDPDQCSVAITDNCRGMEADRLCAVTTDVGMSEKQGQSLANGQFGFGMQAFRACCKRLRVRSRTGSEAALLEIAVPRNQTNNFTLMRLKNPEDLENFPDSGTRVMLEEIEDVWASDKDILSVEGCADEIENHFERMLSRGNLEVCVSGPSGDMQHVCQAVQYADNETEVVVDASFPLGNGQTAKVMLALGSMKRANAVGRRARFFAKGRRIAKVSDTRTFFRASANRWEVWNHPQLLGYIDVLGDDGGPLRPMITRDEFKQTQGSAAAYAKISEMCEGPLLKAIKEANRRTADNSMQELEQTLTIILSSLIEDDDLPESGSPTIPSQASGTPAKENAAKPSIAVEGSRQSPKKKEKKPKESKQERKRKRNEQLFKRAQFPVEFTHDLPDPVDSQLQLRSALMGNKILVNVKHKEFTKRYKNTKKSKAGQPKVNHRICGYFANLLTSHYLDAHYKDLGKHANRQEWYEDYLDFSSKMEEKITNSLPALFSGL